MKFRTPLSLAKGLGSAKSGAHHWWMQRLTALAMIPLTIWFVFNIVSHAGDGYEQTLDWLSNPWEASFLILFFIITYYHAALGIQVVVEDYISSNAWRMFIIIATKFILTVLGAVSVVSVIRIIAV